MQKIRLILFLFVLAIPKVATAEACRLALVLALDVSGSVNEAEYEQQLDGLAFALSSADVRNAILSGGATVKISVFEWSSQNHQFLVLPWLALDSHAAIDQAVARIRAYRKQRAGLKTAMSTAMLFAADLLRQQRHCWKHTIDVSGDGKNNIGPPLDAVYRMPAFGDVTINALVVGDPASPRKAAPDQTRRKNDLRLYFEQTVIRGRGAFAMVAHGYADYARAMEKKLLREVSAPVIGVHSLPSRKQ